MYSKFYAVWYMSAAAQIHELWILQRLWSYPLIIHTLHSNDGSSMIYYCWCSDQIIMIPVNYQNHDIIICNQLDQQLRLACLIFCLLIIQWDSMLEASSVQPASWWTVSAWAIHRIISWSSSSKSLVENGDLPLFFFCSMSYLMMQICDQ
jgi:hypothetical protein